MCLFARTSCRTNGRHAPPRFMLLMPNSHALGNAFDAFLYAVGLVGPWEAGTLVPATFASCALATRKKKKNDVSLFRIHWSTGNYCL